MISISRRTFLNLASTWGVGTALCAGGTFSTKRTAGQPALPSRMRIAHLSHRQGPAANMANYAIMGAQLGAEEANVTAGMFGASVELFTEDAVTMDNVASVAGKLAAQADLAAILSALDDRTTAVLGDLAQQHRILLFNTAARSGELRGERCHRFMFHVEPDLAMHVQALGQWLLQNNRKRWYFVTSADGLGQEVYAHASRFLQNQGGTALGRTVKASGQDAASVVKDLARVEADVLFVAMVGEDLRQFLGRYKTAGLTIPLAGVPLDMLTMWDVGPQHSMGVWSTSWYHELERYSAREVNRRFMRRFGKPPEAYAWANWAAVKLAVEGVLRASTLASTALVNHLESSPPFDGHKGKSLTFRDWNHQLRQPLYLVKARESAPTNPWDLFEVISEMPPATARGKSVAELLDILGESKGERTCRLEAL